MHNYKYLFEPLQVKNIELKNRLMMAPMATRFATAGGAVTSRLIDYYAARAMGGVGTVTVEATAVSFEGRGWGNNLCIHHDKFVPGLSRLAHAIHDGGAIAAIEIFHAGRRTQTMVIGQQPVAPSAVPCTNGEVPRELSKQEISRLIDNFAYAALRAKQAGFDIVNLHVAHGYILQQFISPISNKRTDEYGGDLWGRTRIIVEIITKTRELVGEDFPLFCRLTSDEYTSGGIDLGMSKEVAKILEAAGADLIDVTAGGPEAPHKTTQPMTEPRGCLVHLAEGIKQVVKIPVSVVGRINNPVLAESILRDKKADIIVMGRGLIADPELPIKAFAGNEEDIRPCIACNQGCSDRLAMCVPISCLSNPLVGREGMIQVLPAEKSKNVVVVGGGVAGMEAATIAAQRGHNIVLIEKNSFLGGQAILAGKPPDKQEIDNLIQYYKNQLARRGVSVKLGVEADLKTLEELKADEIILATGALPLVPNIPGLTPEKFVFAWNVLDGSAVVGDRAIIIGGGQVGSETAELLLKEQKQVTIIEMAENIARDMGARMRQMLNMRLIHLGADIMTSTKVVGLEGESLVVDQLGICVHLSGYDTIILAAGATANNPINEQSINNYRIGDCVKPAKLLDAIHTGFSIGNLI